VIAGSVPLRHPSQLYEALLEGVATAVVLWLVYRRGGALVRRNGGLSGLFLLLYALARITVEFFRQPDAQLGTVLGPFSMGQLLSVVMLVAGGYMMMRGQSNERSKVSAAGL